MAVQNFISFVIDMMAEFITTVNSVKIPYTTQFGNTIRLGAFNVLFAVIIIALVIGLFVKSAKM